MKLEFIWSSVARAQLRHIERQTAMRILTGLTRYGETGDGDIKALEGRFSGTHRLRIGDWRIRLRARPAEQSTSSP